ncbi:MAG: hypothetical protein LBE04_01650 [Prevotellaceae bacterium]|nr:hypothetical protein [Prevotellaceae bacterium]
MTQKQYIRQSIVNEGEVYSMPLTEVMLSYSFRHPEGIIVCLPTIKHAKMRVKY